MTFAEQLIEEGIEQRDREIVLRMEASGMEPPQISSLTGLEEAKVYQIFAGKE